MPSLQHTDALVFRLDIGEEKVTMTLRTSGAKIDNSREIASQLDLILSQAKQKSAADLGVSDDFFQDVISLVQQFEHNVKADQGQVSVELTMNSVNFFDELDKMLEKIN